jgi:hypothetical protein
MKLPRARLHSCLRWLLLGLCAFFAWHGVHAGLRSVGSDFSIYYAAGEAVRAGHDPTTVERFLYLPAFAVAMAPLAWLPYSAALVVWQGGSLLALAWIVARCRLLCERELGRALPWLDWAPLACALRLVDSNLANGQVNILVLALIVIALEAWLAARAARAGTWLGCATALKIVPVFLVLLFVFRRSWRAVLATAGAVLACVLLVPAAVLGWQTNLSGIERWFQECSLPYLRGGSELLAERGYLPGQSLTGAAYRLLSDTPSTSQGPDAPRANVLDLDPERVNFVVRLASASVLAVVSLSLAISVRRSSKGARLREAGLVVCAALALAPLVHKAHMVWLLVPYAVLLSGAPSGLGPIFRRARWFLVTASVLAIGGTTPALLGRELATAALARGAVLFGLLLAMAALLVDVWGARAPALESAR